MSISGDSCLLESKTGDVAREVAACVDVSIRSVRKEIFHAKKMASINKKREKSTENKRKKEEKKRMKTEKKMRRM